MIAITLRLSELPGAQLEVLDVLEVLEPLEPLDPHAMSVCACVTFTGAWTVSYTHLTLPTNREV